MNDLVRYSFYSDVEAKNVNWLWYPYIAYGKITILQGDPGDGKSTFILQLAAILTSGGVMPNGEQLKEPCTVLYQCAEDSLEDTIKPRLLAAGADCTKMVFINDSEDELTLDDERIRLTLQETNAKLLVLDPIQAFIPKDCDMQSATKVRAVMRKLANIAAECNCAVVLIGHMTKSPNGKKLYRGLGSIDIAAIARSVLMIMRDEDVPERRYVYHIKSNLSEEGAPIGFELRKENGFHWVGVCENVNPFAAAAEKRHETKKDMAKDFLTNLLTESAKPSLVIYSRMNKIGISERTVRSAGKELGITAIKRGREWYWSLPSAERNEEDKLDE